MPPAAIAAPALSVRGLRVSFGAEPSGGRTILDDVTFEVCDGAFLCVVGASGTGKTTLLRALAGLVRPSGGELLFYSQAITGPSRDRAIIFQDYSKALLPWRTVRGNIALSLDPRGVPAPHRDAIIDELIGKMGLMRARDQFP